MKLTGKVAIITGGSSIIQQKKLAMFFLFQAISEHPIGRIGMSEDVAKAILYFASDDSSWATGAVLPLDGGMAAR
jgi:NAD(P)-dependent dehydrogenase (short-subunit alcohol dehydrogenase family)